MQIAYMYQLGQNKCRKGHGLTQGVFFVATSNHIGNQRNDSHHNSLVNNLPYHPFGHKPTFGVAWLTLHNAFLGRINAKGQGRQTVGGQVDPQDMDGKQRNTHVENGEVTSSREISPILVDSRN